MDEWGWVFLFGWILGLGGFFSFKAGVKYIQHSLEKDGDILFL